MSTPLPPPADDEVIRPDEVKRALQASGYLLEVSIAQQLEDKNFHVELNTFRSDPRDENKWIEVDVCGVSVEVVGIHGSTVVVEPFIECKNNSQPVAFFMRSQSLGQDLNDTHIKYAGFPSSIVDPDTKHDVPLHKLLSMRNWHHYCQSQEVATQFCTFSRSPSAEDQKRKDQHLGGKFKRDDWCWRAEAMKPYSDSFSDLCIVVNSAGHGGRFSFDQDNIEVNFYYPIVVFQGPIYEVRASNSGIEVALTDHLQFHHSTSVRGRIIQAQIDVVSRQGLLPLIDTIISEHEQIAAGIQEHYSRLHASAIDQKKSISPRPRMT